jgi:hypothetical protein
MIALADADNCLGGLALVPREPTGAMIEAVPPALLDDAEAVETRRAMLSAAPGGDPAAMRAAVGRALDDSHGQLHSDRVTAILAALGLPHTRAWPFGREPGSHG